MGAKADDVHLSHSGRENSEKLRGEQGGSGSLSAPSFYSNVGFMTAKPLITVIEMKGKFS
jgi:hypothetical protein